MRHLTEKNINIFWGVIIMKFFLNPIGLSEYEITFFTIIKAIIFTFVFLILLCITIHKAKKERDIKQIVPLIVADCLVLAFGVVILILID